MRAFCNSRWRRLFSIAAFAASTAAIAELLVLVVVVFQLKREDLPCVPPESSETLTSLTMPATFG